MSTTHDLRESIATTTSEPEARPRSVAGIFRATPPHWVGDGFFVSSYFPRPSLPAKRVSPFLLMDYGPARDYPAARDARRGVGWHPHRGFETVTVAWEGSVEHHDNAGHSGVIGPGDVQWMTAASGILHKEYHAEDFARRGGRLHMMQLWVNLPKKDKMGPPGYQPITSDTIPVVELEDDGGSVRVIAGAYRGHRGPARTFTPITMLDARLKAAGRISVGPPSHHNALVIVAAGSVRIGDKVVRESELALLDNDGDHLEIVADGDAHVLVLAGEPIDEPIVHYGPFVMNTVEEIERAITDLDSGRFGELPD